MIRVTQPLIATMLALAVLGSGFLAVTHSHPHDAGHAKQLDNPNEASQCSCLEHGSDSELPASPCEHDDCQLCKFMHSLGWVSVPDLEFHSQNDFQILSLDEIGLVKASIAAAYLGRAPPTV